jgi:hypothetical protein
LQSRHPIALAPIGRRALTVEMIHKIGEAAR